MDSASASAPSLNFREACCRSSSPIATVILARLAGLGSRASFWRSLSRSAPAAAPATSPSVSKAEPAWRRRPMVSFYLATALPADVFEQAQASGGLEVLVGAGVAVHAQELFVVLDGRAALRELVVVPGAEEERGRSFLGVTGALFEGADGAGQVAGERQGGGQGVVGLRLPRAEADPPRPPPADAAAWKCRSASSFFPSSR